MTKPIVLTGGETVYGTAIDNTGTDNFLVYGAGNTIYEGGGNLIVNGGDGNPYGYDTQTTINLGDAVSVNDTIMLDGSQNIIQSNQYGTPTALIASTVKIVVTGDGTHTPGHNTVNLDNADDGTTSIRLTGSYNSVTLNGDATNTILGGNFYETIKVGVQGDGLYGYRTSITVGGSNNSITGGDENFTIIGGNKQNSIALGDGNNSVSLIGADNTISVWGGTNVITAGSGSDTVSILGSGGTNNPNWTYNPNNPQGGPPTDTVNIAGSNDVVAATYENVVINGSSATGNAKISLGNGNNSVTLDGDANAIGLGNGTNTVNLTGNDNAVSVTDPTGVGTDYVSVGKGTGDVISLNYAEGSVAGSTSGTTTVTQNADASNVVTINLPVGTGLISLGTGNDLITANGNSSVIVAGDGNDTVNANGSATSVTLGNGTDVVNANGFGAVVVAGNGSDTVAANGGGASVTLGNGNDTVTANGGSSIVTAGNGNDNVGANGGSSAVILGNGNDIVTANGGNSSVVAGNGNDNVAANGASSSVTLGHGDDTVSATGSGSSVTISAIAKSLDSVTVGSNDTVRITSGVDQISGVAGNSVYLNSAQLNTNVLLSGNSNLVFLGTDTTANLVLNQAQSGDVITVQADAGNTYGGTIDISSFDLQDVMQLNGLVGGIDGNSINSFAEVLDNMRGGPFGATLYLHGGGSILFAAETGFTSNQFKFGTQTGPVSEVHPVMQINHF